jgi:hypothetical protein
MRKGIADRREFKIEAQPRRGEKASNGWDYRLWKRLCFVF